MEIHQNLRVMSSTEDRRHQKYQTKKKTKQNNTARVICIINNETSKLCLDHEIVLFVFELDEKSKN